MSHLHIELDVYICMKNACQITLTMSSFVQPQVSSNTASLKGGYFFWQETVPSPFSHWFIMKICFPVL